jgi:hypothetical protein
MDLVSNLSLKKHGGGDSINDKLRAYTKIY